MKPLGFLISLLVHALFLLLVVTIRFPVPDRVVPLHIIQVVPMSPPPASARPVAPPRPVYVRPFVSLGGTPGEPGAAAHGQPSRAGSSPPPRDRGPAVSPAAATRGAPLPGDPAPQRAAAGIPPAAAGDKRLRIDLARVAEKLRRQGPAARAGVPEGSSASPGVGLAFGDALAPSGASGGAASFGPGGGADGDGTSSHALGGNAFFDSRGYDITPWARRMVYRVKKNWIFPPATAYGLRGAVGVYVLIERDGSIGQVYIREASGIRPFDQAAFNAVELSAPLPPLPDDFPYDDLPAYLLFYYN